MTVFDHENPFLNGAFAPVRSEDDYELAVTGELPAGLVGSLYRNGPNPQFEPPAGHHWFHGDGMVHAFHIENGKVSYTNRFVRTPKWLAENEAGRLLAPKDYAGGAASGIANTHVVWHGDRLLALEEMHAPFELDPRTLASAGFRDFGGPVTAHPKFDPQTGEMIFFAFSADGPLSATLHYGVADAAGTVTRREAFQAPYCSMIHDFMVTRDHVLFPVLPLSGDMERARAGGPAFAWDPGKGGFVGVMRRDDPVGAMRWFSVAPNYVYHVMNAWDGDGEIVADVMQFETAPLFPNADGSLRAPAPARLTRWRFDLSGATDEVRQEPLDDFAGEFPRFDERRSGLSYRHGWFAGQRENPGALSYDSLAYIDVATGRRQVWAAPAGDTVSEPVFAPRSPSAEEGDGWILAVVHRGHEDLSDLLVFEARDIDRGPLAEVRVPRRVPAGFHGSWRAGA